MGGAEATGRGGAIILWKGEHEGIIRWHLAAPEGEGVTMLEPGSIDEFPGMVADKLDASARTANEAAPQQAGE